jgi:hypothetical protein
MAALNENTACTISLRKALQTQSRDAQVSDDLAAAGAAAASHQRTTLEAALQVRMSLRFSQRLFRCCD